MVSLLLAGDGAARLEGQRIGGDLARRRPRVAAAAPGADRRLDRASDPDRRRADRRLHRALAPRPRGAPRRAARCLRDLGPSGLAGRAEPCAPARVARPRNRRAAPVARLALPALALE